MITERTETKIITIKTYHCDFCDYKHDNTNSSPLRRCNVCNKHMCRTHENWYEESPNCDYDYAVVCPKCDGTFRECWEWAEDNAGRYEQLHEVALKRHRKILES